MSDVSILTDLKTASVLAGATGILGAITVPFLLPAVMEFAPTADWELPLPLPIFCVVLAVQFLIIYGLLAWAGLRLARARQRNPAPRLTALWLRQIPQPFAFPAMCAFGTGLICGAILVAKVALIKVLLPSTLPDVMHPSSLGGALLASATGSFGEEILCRLFLLSALLRILAPSTKNTIMAVLTSSLIFGALHAPAAIFLFGGLANVPILFWIWMISLNAFVGVFCAVWYLRIGIGGAILTHFGADLVWHVMSQLT